MHHNLEKHAYFKVLPLLEAMPRDPMMYTILEGNQAGQVLVDHPGQPGAALVWSGMEYAYLAGENAVGFIKTIQSFLEDTALPALQDAGLGFISIFPENREIQQGLQDAFAHRSPTCFGVDHYTFSASAFNQQTAALPPLPEGCTLVRLDQRTLAVPAFQAAREDLVFCWESLDRFLELGLGWAVLHAGRMVSSCWTIAAGAGAYHITICTRPDHRRQGLARHAAAALIGEALENGKTIYWLNDTPNRASRRLAESLGFTHAGVLHPVDIPAEPGPFHRSLAGHFFAYLEDYPQAANFYQTALNYNPADTAALTGLARAQLKLDQPDQAMAALQQAAQHGWEKPAQLAEDRDFAPLHDLPEWEQLFS